MTYPLKLHKNIFCNCRAKTNHYILQQTLETISTNQMRGAFVAVL